MVYSVAILVHFIHKFTLIEIFIHSKCLVIYWFIKCDHSYFKMLSFSRVSHIINIDTWGLRYLWLLDWEWLNWLSGADWSDWLEMIGVSSLVARYSVKWSISILPSYSRLYHDEEFLISFYIGTWGCCTYGSA